MAIRKSNRIRTLTAKVLATGNGLTNNKPVAKRHVQKRKDSSFETPAHKKIRLNNPVRQQQQQQQDEEKSDKIDPVEKLLSLTTTNNDILLNLESSHPANNEDDDDSSHNEIRSLNFTKILNDNIRSYYTNFRKSPMEIYNDHSSFALLNKKKEEAIPAAPPATPLPAHQVPFFKNVNFNPKPSSPTSAYPFEEYFSYDELTDNDSEDVGPSDSTKFNNNFRFHYRHKQNNLNLSLENPDAYMAKSPVTLSNDNSEEQEQHELFKILNKRSVLTGKASEMVSTGNFLINDFFL